MPDLPNFANCFVYMYKLIKNLYNIKDTIKIWYDCLTNGIPKWGWIQSSIDECLFTKNGFILVIYVNDAILISPSKQNVNNEITSLMKDYDITE